VREQPSHSAECRHPECHGTSMLIQEWLQSGGKKFFPEKLKEFFFSVKNVKRDYYFIFCDTKCWRRRIIDKNCRKSVQVVTSSFSTSS
jgi:hypothetical protein